VLTLRQAQRGVSLIELMIGLAILAVLLAMAAPSFSAWIQNTQIRTVAETVQNGLQLARAEAVRRNTQVRFQLTTTTDNSCALSTANNNWVVSLDDPSGQCASAPSDTVAPRIMQVRPAAEGGVKAVVAADRSTLVFNGWGQVSAGSATINISNPSGGTCAALAGPMHCLNVMVTTGGQVRMCDPARASSDPQGC
jgi:type IV fimbrial biogenesis protein FimT